jgi:hypothetical protein
MPARRRQLKALIVFLSILLKTAQGSTFNHTDQRIKTFPVPEFVLCILARHKTYPRRTSRGSNQLEKLIRMVAGITEITERKDFLVAEARYAPNKQLVAIPFAVN